MDDYIVFLHQQFEYMSHSDYRRGYSLHCIVPQILLLDRE